MNDHLEKYFFLYFITILKIQEDFNLQNQLIQKKKIIIIRFCYDSIMNRIFNSASQQTQVNPTPIQTHRFTVVDFGQN